MYVRPQLEAGPATSFGVSGKLWRGALVLYDRDSRSLWSQIDGRAFAGPLTGTTLRPLPARLMRWSEWRRQHPASEVLVKPPLAGTVYHRYHRNAGWAGLPWQRRPDRRLADKALVAGMVIDGSAAAVPLDQLRARPIHQFELGAGSVAVFSFGDPLAATAFLAGGHRFEPCGGQPCDRATGTTWDPRSGVAIEGPLAGHALEPVVLHTAYWGVWARFHDTVLPTVAGVPGG